MLTIQLGNVTRIWEPLHGGPFIEVLMDKHFVSHSMVTHLGPHTEAEAIPGLTLWIEEGYNKDHTVALDELLAILTHPDQASTCLPADDELIVQAMVNKAIKLLRAYLNDHHT